MSDLPEGVTRLGDGPLQEAMEILIAMIEAETEAA